MSRFRAVDVSVEQALAFRVAGHHLDRRVGAGEAVAAFGLQEYPPEWGALAALRARSDEPLPGDVVQVNAFRGSPYVVRRADARMFTAALVPEDEAGLKALVGSASAKEVIDEGFNVRDALDRVAAAAREGLADGPLDRDAFHQAMRERLPDGLLPWCRGCQSHHVRPGFWRALGPLEVTEMPEKATWAPRRPAGHAARGGARRARAALPARLRAGDALAARVAGADRGLARQAPVRGDRRRARARRGRGPQGVRAGGGCRAAGVAAGGAGVRLLGGHDPYVAQPDREALVPDAALRKRLFPSVGRPGAVLADGVLAGLWRGYKKGDVLEVGVEWLGDPVDVAEEAEAIARIRGCEDGGASSPPA